MTYLTREAILAKDDVQIEELHVPQWGGTVRVRGMSGTQRDAFEKAISREKRGPVHRSVPGGPPLRSSASNCGRV